MARKIVLKQLGSDPKLVRARFEAKEITEQEAIAALRERWVDYRDVIADIMAAPEDQRAGMSGEDIRVACLVADKFAKAIGDFILLEDADYETLARKVRVFRWGGLAHPNVVRFLDDIKDAEKVDINAAGKLPSIQKSNGHSAAELHSNA